MIERDRIKAIPTEYRGVKFRSRLEASWAAHFDKLELPWMYEPEGFELSDGSWYLPDFWLPTAKAWAEVKGLHKERMDKVERFAMDLWRQSSATSTYDHNAPMVLLFETPYFERWHGDFRLNTNDGSWCYVNPVGIMGPGKGYSVAFAKCTKCRQRTIIALWQNLCRNCGFNHDEDWDAVEWHDSVYSTWHFAIDNPKWFQFLRPTRLAP